jgi:hypothetical protein
MTYDGSDPDSDGVVEADVNNELLSTRELNKVQVATPGDDLTAKINQTPKGGTLFLTEGSFDIPSNGRIISNKGVIITGSGWYRDNNGNLHGTVLDNTGDNSLDEPLIEIDAPFATQDVGGIISNLAVKSDSASSAGVKVSNLTHTKIKNIIVDGRQSLSQGIKFEGRSFFGRVLNSQIRATVDKGIYIEDGPGFEYRILNTQITMGNANDSAVCIDTERIGTWIVGGQQDVGSSVFDGVGIRFNKTSDSRDGRSGGVIQTVHESSPTGIEVTASGSAEFDSIEITRPLFNLKRVETGVRLGRTTSSVVNRPMDLQNGGDGDMVEFGSGSRGCTYVVDRSSYSKGVVNNQATKPLMLVPWQASNGLIENLPTTTPISVAYSSSSNSPIFFDGTNWNEVSHTEFTP